MEGLKVLKLRIILKDLRMWLSLNAFKEMDQKLFEDVEDINRFEVAEDLKNLRMWRILKD